MVAQREVLEPGWKEGESVGGSRRTASELKSEHP